jgi:hypothetical protein
MDYIEKQFKSRDGDGTGSLDFEEFFIFISNALIKGKKL